MQTFLPYSDYAETAKVLDMKRLGKQRVETMQILNALIDPAKGWKNHPATKMWRGHEAGLSAYGVVICTEWISRGYKDTCLGKISAIVAPDFTDIPRWVGDTNFHLTHQSNLLRKDPDHYRQYFPTVQDDLEYIWPI